MSGQWKNRLIGLFFSAGKESKPPTKNPKHVLIVSTTGLGDTLWATPAIESLKNAHPSLKITALVTPLAKQVLKKNPHIENFVIFEKPFIRSFFRCYKQLKKISFDCIFIFHSSQRLIFPLCASLNSPHLVGTSKLNKGLDYLFTKLYPNTPIHEASRRLQQVSFLGADTKGSSLTFYAQEEIEPFKDPTKKAVLIHPGAQDRYKCWPISCYQDLAKNLWKKGAQIYLSGTPREKDLIAAILHAVPEAIYLPPASIGKFATQMSVMDLVITNDTGPMHLATALDTAVIAIFAPTFPELCGPFHAKHAIVFDGKRTCTPCLKRKCREPFCLLQTSPKQVLEKADEILQLAT